MNLEVLAAAGVFLTEPPLPKELLLKLPIMFHLELSWQDCKGRALHEAVEGSEDDDGVQGGNGAL